MHRDNHDISHTGDDDYVSTRFLFEVTPASSLNPLQQYRSGAGASPRLLSNLEKHNITYDVSVFVRYRLYLLSFAYENEHHDFSFFPLDLRYSHYALNLLWPWLPICDACHLLTAAASRTTLAEDLRETAVSSYSPRSVPIQEAGGSLNVLFGFVYCKVSYPRRLGGVWVALNHCSAVTTIYHITCTNLCIKWLPLPFAEVLLFLDNNAIGNLTLRHVLKLDLAAMRND